MDSPDFQRRWALIQKDIVIPQRPMLPPRPDPKPLPHRNNLLKPNPVTRPSDSLLTSNQHYMLHEFQKCGRQALASAIYVIASEHGSDRNAANVDLLVDDQTNKTWYVVQLLETLPDTVIESLIKCTLPYDYYKGNDVDLQLFVNNQMGLVETPGIYLSLPNYGKDKEGKCLSGRQLKGVLADMDDYYEDSPADEDKNRKIDAFFTGAKEIAERRWGKDETSKTTAKDWIGRVKEMYLQGLPDADLDERFTRCLAQCGWGNNIALQAAAHTTNVDTTDLFAPYNALTRRVGFEAPLQLTLFPIWKKKAELCRVAEIVGHILCSAYWFEGGLNTYWAGDVGADIQAADFHYDVNAKRVSDRLELIKLFNQNQDESKLEKLRNVDELMKREKAAEQEYLEEKEKFEKAKADAEKEQAIQEEVRALVQKSRELTKETGRRIDELRSSNQAKSADRVRSIRDRARNLPRNTHAAGPLESTAELRRSIESEPTSTSTATEDPSTSTATEHTSTSAAEHTSTSTTDHPSTSTE